MGLKELDSLEPTIPWTPGYTPGGACNAGGGVGGAVSMSFNEAGDRLAFIFQAPSSTPPDEIRFYIGGVTTPGTTGNIEATLETLDSSGMPSGTPVTNSATGSGTFSTVGVKSITGIAGTASLTPGTGFYALVLTAGAGWDRTLAITYTIGSAQGTFGFPYLATKESAGSWAKWGGTNAGWCVGLRTSGGLIVEQPGFVGPYSACANQAFSDSTNPDERGNTFLLTVPRSCIGVIMGNSRGSSPGATTTMTINLYSDHLVTPDLITSVDIPGGAQGSGYNCVYRFATAVPLVPARYAIAIKATSTGQMNLIRHDYSTNNDLEFYLSKQMYSTTRNDGSGAFTDDSAKVYSIFPLFSKLHDGFGTRGRAALGV